MSINNNDFSLSQRASVASLPASPGGKAKSIAAALLSFVEFGGLAGAVTGVANREKILSLDAVGFADIAAGKAMPTDAIFWVASQTKPVTAAAVMMLVDEGKIRLDDPVIEYLPEFKEQWLAVEQDEQHILLKKPAKPITIRHLLTHTSGMNFSTPIEQPTLDMLRLCDAVRSYAMAPLQTEPGTKYRYSNAGVNTAARILEVVSGMAYEDFLDDRLFKPLGMIDTTFWPNQRQIARIAKSYRPNADKTALEAFPIGQLHYPLDDRRRQPMPAGGLFATTSDMLRFCQMLLNGGIFQGRRYLSENAVNQMTIKQTPPELSDSYGLCLSTSNGVFGHGGAYATHMSIDANRNLILIYHLQHCGFIHEGEKAHAAFKQAAEELFIN